MAIPSTNITGPVYGLDLDRLRAEVTAWFTPVALARLLGPPRSETERIAQDWLSRGGKRWRPFLALGTWQALQDDPDCPFSPALARVAVGGECSHKASLVHDDIEDDDDRRYGQPTLHVAHGVAVALNVGDFLLGEGYRLIAECGESPARCAALLRVAAEGHRALSLGQGAELCWARHPQPLAPRDVLDIFRGKTAPAFAVALQFGAILAGAADDVRGPLAPYSEALGIAYQIRDDLADYHGHGDSNDPAARRPSLVLALAWDHARGPARQLLDDLWRRQVDYPTVAPELARVLAELRVEDETRRLLATYRQQAVTALADLGHPRLRDLLRLVLDRIFADGDWAPRSVAAVPVAARE